jgi:MYXO-CTERM domain-containing protein
VPVRRGAAALIAALVWMTTDASAHVQVSPTTVAPDDAVRFTVLVPGERAAQTTRVAFKMPAGVLPFSWQDTPGWKRKLVRSAPLQNAGGESGPPAGGPAPSSTVTPSAPEASVTPSAVASEPDGSDWVARGLAVAALLALAGISVQIQRRRVAMR